MALDGPVVWAAGTRAAIQATPQGGLRIVVQDSRNRDLPEGTMILIDEADWQGTGALAFQGQTVVGDSIGSGARHYLDSGAWEARQQTWLSWVLGGRARTVLEGDLVRGVQAQVLEGDDPALVDGYLTPGSGTFFRFFVASSPGDTSLEVRYFGAIGSSRLRPSWIDSAITSSVLIAVITVLGLFATLLQIWSSVADGLRGGGREN